jgi:CRISPR/Cas system-associated exonuclease Cas4 (RecB family)
MTLPDHFQFSQGSLQDYVDCPRRFQLRYLLQVDWPAVEAEPVLESERHAQLGAAFHRLVHQHRLGIDPQRLSRAIQDADLRRWWHNYLERGPRELPGSRYSEVVLSAPLGSYRLVARYDLVAVGTSHQVDIGQRVAIVDWKTSRKRPKRQYLAGRLQTRVYPYLMVRAGDHLNGGQPFAPGQVEMIYWFADYPNDPARFVYEATQYEADEAYLTALVREIESLEDFPLTPQERHCRYCPYRSLCRRGVEAGSFDQVEDELPLDELGVDLDFEQIAEIEY